MSKLGQPDIQIRGAGLGLSVELIFHTTDSNFALLVLLPLVEGSVMAELLHLVSLVIPVR